MSRRAATWMLTLLAARAWGDTIYVSPSGNDGDPGTLTLPKRTLPAAVAAMTGGGTLVLAPGTWVGQLSGVPSGTALQPTLVRAEQPGTAIIDGNAGLGLPYPAAALDLPVGHDFVTVEGLTFRNGGDLVVSVEGHHVTLRGVSASDADDSIQYSAVIDVSGDDALLEDVWVFGRGRHLIGLYGARNTIRRAVVRFDRYQNGTANVSGVAVQALDALIDNLIMIDFARPPALGNAYAALAMSQSSDRGLVRGSILLNVPGFQVAMYLADSPRQGDARNCVIWDCEGAPVNLGARGSAEHMTIGGVAPGKLVSYTAGAAGLVSSLVVDAGTSGSGITSLYNLYFRATVPANDAFSITADPQQRYLPVVLPGTPGYRTDFGGNDRGANIYFRLTDAGVSTEHLWPWPNEARIRQDFCASTTRGWCGTSKTLTQYIWEYLGTPAPPEVLDAGSSDAGPPDAGPPDGEPPDAGPLDGGRVDAGDPAGGPLDAGPLDARSPDAGLVGESDAGPRREALRLGCGCDGSPTSIASVAMVGQLVLLLLAARRRARR